MARGPARVARPRMVQALARAHAGLVIAPSGYGKSHLADEVAAALGHTTVSVGVSATAGRDPLLLIAALRRALRGAGLRSFAEALELRSDAGEVARRLIELLHERDDPLLLVIDDAQRLSAASSDVIGCLAAEVPAPHQILVLGQTAPHWAAPSSAPPLAWDVEVGAADLAFTADDIHALARDMKRPIDQSEALAIASATGGWPSAAILAIETGSTDARGLRNGLSGLLGRLLVDVDTDARALSVLAAHLPRISETVLVAVGGGGAIQRLRATGIPLRKRSDDWLEMPDPIRDILRQEAPLPDEQARAAATAYFDSDEPDLGIELLLERDDLEGLAAILAARPWQELQRLDPAELRSLISVLPDSAIATWPRLLLSVSRAASAAGELRWRGELLERAAQSATLADDEVLKREIDSDRAALASVHGDIEAAKRLASVVLESAGTGEPATRARALSALGRVRAFERDAGFVADATRYSMDAATLARIAGEREILAATLLVLGYNVAFAEGDLATARARVRESADAVPTMSRGRASNLTFLADVLMYAGELDEADTVLREVADVGRRLRDQGILGYHAWMKAAIASRRDDREALETWLAEAERHPGDWLAHPTGIEFMAEAVDWFGRVDDDAGAARYLSRVRDRVAIDAHEGVDQIELVARAIYKARFGDPAEAESDQVAVLESEQMPAREAWRVHLLRAFAAFRQGNQHRAAQLATRAFEHAAALGHPELPQIHEPRLVDVLLPLARRRAGSSAVKTMEAAELASAVRLLGDFSVTVGGRQSNPPPGRTATLVKLLAVRGRPVPIDDAIETLWPELDPETGRARMRNVLSRIKSASGELVRRDGDALALAPGTAVDAYEFEREARLAMSATGDEAAALASRAVARYDGELLPGDRYEDFSVTLRERLALLHLALLDRLAAHAEGAGDVDEALRRYSEAIAAAPLDEHRYELAAALALRHGRRQRARDLIDSARRMLDDLGVPMSEALSTLRRQLENSETRLPH